MHEILSYLNQQGITTVLVLGQHGVIGDVHVDVDLSYLSDATMFLRFFEAAGQIRTAMFVIKSRTNNHQRTLHEFRITTDDGIQVGDALENFEGILTGLPTYRGSTAMMQVDDSADDGK
jgi:circadian clock protein KaiC